jgi:hypothetical protein
VYLFYEICTDNCYNSKHIFNVVVLQEKTEEEEALEEKFDSFDINHTAPQHRQYLGNFSTKYIPLLRIWIQIGRIHMFLGLPDPHPDPLVRDEDPAPAPYPSIIKQKR